MARAELVLLPCALLLGALTGCERELSLGRLLAAEGSAGEEAGVGDGSRPPAAPMDGGSPSFDASPLPIDRDGGSPDANSAQCAPSGPAVALSDTPLCGPELRGFHFGLCSCGDLQATVQPTGITTVDGFDSRRGAYTPDAGIGSMALAGTLHTGADVGGSLFIAGGAGAPLTDHLRVGHDLHNAGPITGAAFRVAVGGNARVAGDIQVAELSVGGTLTLANEASVLLGTGSPPPIVRGPVAVAPPCRCDEQLALAPILAAARRSNDNASIGLDPEVGLHATRAARELTLPCGSFYVGEILASYPLTIHIAGRVLLHVGDRIVSQPDVPITVELEPGAELDLFVGNSISANGPVRIGDPARPTHTRLYFGGPDTLYFLRTAMLAASVYAPSAPLRLGSASATDLYGAALVKEVTSMGPLNIHYDRALTSGSCLP